MVNKPESEYLTVEEWLAHEAQTGIRHEYIDGDIYAMSGGTDRHSQLCVNITTALNVNLRGRGYRVYNSDLRVKITDTKYVYPDASVACDTPIFADDDRTKLENPNLVVEVTSPSTGYYDMGLKADYYFSVSSVQVYLIVDQDKPHVRIYTKTENG